MDKTLGKISAYLMIIVGALIASFSVICILIPNGAIDYGTAGIAIIISQLTGAELSIVVILTFLPFWLMGFKILGKGFALKSLVGTISYTLGLQIFERVPFELNTEHFIAVIFGGAILGVGLAMILKFGGCIDGSEIFANILISKITEKTGKSYSMTKILLIFNGCVYLSVFFLINETSALMSLLVYVVATFVITNITDHFEAIKQVTIITKNPDEIIHQIRTELNKTCTIMDSYGVIAGENKTLICYINFFELQKIKEIIARNKGSFSTVSTVDEIIR